MTKFADQLFDDLMQEFRPTLDSTELPAARARRAVPRPVWLAAGTSAWRRDHRRCRGAGRWHPAYAVTQNTDGTVTVSINQLSGVAGANDKLHNLGEPVVVVPVRPGCVSITSLPHVTGTHQDIRASVDMTKDGSITVNVRGMPAGETALLATSSSQGDNVCAGSGQGPGTQLREHATTAADGGIVAGGPKSGASSSTVDPGH